MNRNVEIKAVAADLAGIEAGLRARGLEPKELHQRDTFFACAAGRLKLREEGGAAELIFYSRGSGAEARESRYWRSGVSEGASSTALLAAALGVEGVVEKRRVLFLVGQTRVHLDEVAGLGSFLELEVVLRPEQSVEEGKRIALALMAELGVGEDALVGPAYVELLRQRASAE
jgi:adenylate cyclase class IV